MIRSQHLPKTLFTFFCVVTLLQASYGYAQAYNEQVAQGLRELIEEVVRDSGSRGISAAVRMPDGGIIAEAFGYADAETGTLLNAEALLLGGSTGKTFVAATVMSLVEEGRLQLDEPISRWLGTKNWFSRLPNAEDITLRMLLNHSAGLPDHIYQNGFRWEFAKHHFTNAGFYFDPESLVGFILDLPAIAPAGQQHSYTDTGYILIGMIVEHVTGNTYFDELKNRVLRPLGLSAVKPSNSMSIDGLVPGYVSGGIANYLTGIAGKNIKEGRLNLNPAMEWTGGGLATNPSSLVLFYSELFNGRLLAQSSVNEMITSTADIPNRPDQKYGLGVFVLNNAEFGNYFHHSGWYPGYTTNVIHYADIGITVAVQFNQDYNVDIYESVKQIARLVKRVLGDVPSA